MNLLEVWIEDIISIEDIEVNGSSKLKITFNTICWGSRDVKTIVFDDMEEWNKFKAKKYYLA